jgi:hypothetical protein
MDNNYLINVNFLENTQKQLNNKIHKIKENKTKLENMNSNTLNKLTKFKKDTYIKIFNYYYYKKLLNVLHFNKIIIEKIINI